jgi:hypothetical protein
MLKKHLLKISLLLPLVAMSSTVASASASVDLQKRLAYNNQHRPNQPAEYGALVQVGPPAARTGGSQNDLRSAFARDRTESRLQPATVPNQGEFAWRYHGGPKSPW